MQTRGRSPWLAAPRASPVLPTPPSRPAPLLGGCGRGGFTPQGRRLDLTSFNTHDYARRGKHKTIPRLGNWESERRNDLPCATPTAIQSPAGTRSAPLPTRIARPIPCPRGLGIPPAAEQPTPGPSASNTLLLAHWFTVTLPLQAGMGGGGRMFLQVKGHVSCFAFPPNYLPKLGTLLCVCWVTGQQETRLQPQACRPQGGAPGVTPCARLQSPRVSEPVAAPETTTEGSFSLSGAVPAQPPRGRLFLFFFIPVFYKCIALF